MSKKNSSAHHVTLAIVIPLVALIVIGALVAGVGMGYARVYEGKMFPGVRVMGMDVGGKTPVDAQAAVQKTVDALLAKGFTFRFRGASAHLDATNGATNPDLAREFVHVDVPGAIRTAYTVGRGGNIETNALTQIQARMQNYDVDPEVTIDAHAVTARLKSLFQSQIDSPKDASFIYGSGVVSVSPEVEGVEFSADRALDELKKDVRLLQVAPIVLDEIHTPAKYTAGHLQPLLPKATEFIQRPVPTFTYQDVVFPMTSTSVFSWLRVSGDPAKPSIGIDPQRFAHSLKDVAGRIEQPAKDGSLDIADGKIISFIPGSQGLEIDATGTLALLQKDWPAERTFPLLVKVSSGRLLGEDPEALGIKEIIGVGRSNFSGSPSNRVKNIKKGADKVNGSIIGPGEEFSLIKALGAIDEASGWFSELVIKGDKTTPEFGGGLCQVGTTVFRGALDSGLKITERQNHSYRVRYYEPAGTDATIYDPKPDFRFVNDTAHSVLLHAYIKGSDAVFEFWGTKDGRKVDPIKPTVKNIVQPPPMKITETLDLKPGVKKCTETAHAGADASFAYNITYADGTKHEEVFNSHYRPWQAVCLVGVEKLSDPLAKGSSTSTK